MKRLYPYSRLAWLRLLPHGALECRKPENKPKPKEKDKEAMPRLSFCGTARVTNIEYQEGVSKSGNAWRKAVVTLDCDPGSKWPSPAQVTLFGDRAAMAEGLEAGMDVRVTGRVAGREYNGRIYLDLEADDARPAYEAQITPQAPAQAPAQAAQPQPEKEELPF